MASDGSSGRRRALILGAGTAGRMVADSLLALGPDASHEPVGFLDDDASKAGQSYAGVPVLGPLSALEATVAARGVDTVLVCVALASSDVLRGLVQRSRAAGAASVRVVPSNSQLALRRASFGATREVSVEDLLVRDPVVVDSSALRDRLRGQRVLVTGAAGSIGAELSRQLAALGPARLLLLDQDESRLHDVHMELEEARTDVAVTPVLLDLRDARELEGFFAAERPDVVFHAAAYKHVPMMERHPRAALEVNVLGTANLVAAARRAATGRLVLISTDKAVEPTTVMGTSKRVAEALVLREHAAPAGTVVRFGNVLGSRGSVVPTFERQIARGDRVTVTHPDVERFFMMTSEAVALVLQAFLMGRGGDLYLLDMGRPIKILDLARAMIAAAGRVPDRDVRIDFVGLRAGEKLTERLSDAGERRRPTGHPRVLALEPGAPLDADAVLDHARRAAAQPGQEAARAFFADLMARLSRVAA